MAKKNKVHFGVLVQAACNPRSKSRRAMCGADKGQKFGNVVPSSKEARDVTCKTCKRMLKKRK